MNLEAMLKDHELTETEAELRKLRMFCIEQNAKIILLLQPNKRNVFSWYLTIKRKEELIVDLEYTTLNELLKKANKTVANYKLQHKDIAIGKN